MKPIIGITPSAQHDTLAHGTFLRHCLSAPYIDAVATAGGVPVILPPALGNASLILDSIDGLLLSGGPDVEPMRYGDETIHAATYGVDPVRDQWELDLFHAALRHGTPIFGICRGIQVINVALGGTLIQDLATEHPGAAKTGHRQHERGLEDSAAGHRVTACDGSLLPIFDDKELGVNSFHHQAIRELAADLISIAIAPDGLIEAVALPGDRTVFGVQWHPELMFERHPEHLQPFVRLVDAAAERKLTSVMT